LNEAIIHASSRDQGRNDAKGAGDFPDRSDCIPSQRCLFRRPTDRGSAAAAREPP
jgi:hypothetical protein